MNPIYLGGAGTRTGLGLAEALAQQQQPQQRRMVGDPKAPQYGDSARAYGMAEALSPIEITSGTYGEALAEAIAGGLRGRAARSERQSGIDQEQWAANAEQKTEGARSSAISQALENFDPANPQAVVQGLRQGAPEEALSLAGALAGRAGATERFGPLEQIDGRLGQPNLTTGQYDWAPQTADYQSRMQPGMPVQGAAGYVWGPNGTQVPAQGGPADRRISEQQRSIIARSISALDAGANIEQSINDAEQLVSGWSTGFVGGTTGDIPGTPAYNLRRAIDTITGNLGFEALQNMRDNSPTGGALGQVAVQELMMLQSVVDSFDNAQSEGQLRAALRRARNYVARRSERNRRILEAYQIDGGSEAPAQTAPEPVQGDQPRVMQWSPERGVY